MINCATCTLDDQDVKTCTYEDVNWKFIYINCKANDVTCRGKLEDGAYLPAITVCNQKL